jgi:hypothetical protein
MSGPADDVPGPDASPAPTTLFAQALARVTAWYAHMASYNNSDQLYYSVNTQGEPVFLYGSDVKMMLLGAVAWYELVPLVGGGLSEGTRHAIDSVAGFVEKYKELPPSKHTGALLSSLDGASLDMDAVGHVVQVLEHVDAVAKRNPIEGADA